MAELAIGKHAERKSLRAALGFADRAFADIEPHGIETLSVGCRRGAASAQQAVQAGKRGRAPFARQPINRQTGHRLKQQLVDEHTGDLVEAADIARGYEVGKGDYVLIEDDELEDVAIESQHTIDIDRFVPRTQIDERDLVAPYYLVPNDKVGQDAFAVIRAAMRGKAMVALGRVVLAKRERVIMLQPWGKGLMGTTLLYAYEVREASSYFYDLPDVTVPQDMLKLAEHILESKAGDFEPATFADRYEEAVVAMLRTKQSGRAVSTIEPRFRDAGCAATEHVQPDADTSTRWSSPSRASGTGCGEPSTAKAR